MVRAGLTSDQRASLNKTVEELKLSSQEVDKFEKAFKDPEFLRLFEEYAKEMEDPANKAETEAYLRQVEGEGQFENVYGKGAQLVVPSPEFVVKTKIQKDTTKVFINVCSSDKIEKATCSDATGENGARGQSWAIPLSLSVQRKGEDKEGKECWVYDFTVNPDTICKADGNPRFLDIVMDSAFERVEEATKSKLQRNYKRLRMKFKVTATHDKPGVQAIRGEGGQSEGGRLKPNASQAGLAGLQPQPADNAPAPSNSKGSAFSFGQPKAKPPPRRALRPCDPGFQHAGGEVTPRYEVVESGMTDLADAWGDRSLAAKASCPKHLVLRVDLPGLATIAGVDLQVSPKKVELRVAGTFCLELDLRYRVNDEESKAKFDKSRSRLEVTLRVIPPPAPAPVKTPAPTLAPALIEEIADDPDNDPSSAPNAGQVDSEPILPAPTSELEPQEAPTAVSKGAESGLPSASAPAHQASQAESTIVNADCESRALTDVTQESQQTAVDAACDETRVAACADASGAPDLKAMASRWAQINQERDEADRRAVLALRATPAAQENTCSGEGTAAGAAAPPDGALAPDSEEGASRGAGAYAAALADAAGHASGSQAQADLGHGLAAKPVIAQPIVLAPALQMSFAEELD